MVIFAASFVLTMQKYNGYLQSAAVFWAILMVSYAAFRHVVKPDNVELDLGNLT